MPLQIEENIRPLPPDFKWGQEWVAVRMWRELDDNGEHLYAFLVRKFGPNDYGTKREDELWIGREIEYIKERDWQKDPRKPRFGERVDVEADTVTESIWDEKKGTYVQQETPVNARKTYKFLHDANNKEIQKQYKTLVQLTGRIRTKLYFVYNNGSRIVSIENMNDFFDHSVKELAEQERQTNSIFNKPKQRQMKGISNSDEGNELN